MIDRRAIYGVELGMYAITFFGLCAAFDTMDSSLCPIEILISHRILCAL